MISNLKCRWQAHQIESCKSPFLFPPQKTVSLIRKLTTHLPYCCHRDQQSKHHEGPNAKHLQAGRLRGYSKHLLNTSTRLQGHRGRLQCTQPLWLDPHPVLHPGNLVWYRLALCAMKFPWSKFSFWFHHFDVQNSVHKSCYMFSHFYYLLTCRAFVGFNSPRRFRQFYDTRNWAGGWCADATSRQWK